MADGVAAGNNNASRQPNVMGPAVQLVQSPQGTSFHGVQSSSPRGNPSFNASAGVLTGGIQLACGVASLILGIVFVGIRSYYSTGAMGAGIWSGIVFFIPAGILGLLTRKRPQSVIVAYMVLSILSSIAAGIALLLYCGEAFTGSWHSFNKEAHEAILVLLFLVTITEFLVSIIAASICCCSGNCCSSQSTGTGTAPVVYYYQAMPAGYAMPQGMVTYSSTTQQSVPGAPAVNNNVQQPFSVAHYPGGQPPMQWQPMAPGQPQVAPQPPMGQQPQNNPMGGGVMAQAPAIEKPPPYN